MAISGKTTSEQGISLAGYKYENKQGNFKNYIPTRATESTPIRMEYDKYAISMTPTGALGKMVSGVLSRGSLQSDVVRAIDNSNENRNVKMVYGSKHSDAYLEYISLNEGIKENIVLTDVPTQNTFTFKMSLTGLTYRMDESGGITFYDEVTGDIVAGIEVPYMNDATGEAYSEDIDYSMQRIENSDDYTLTVTVDENYLNDTDRVYPVTIDPTITWDVSSGFREAYVNSGSPNTNYYGSSYRVMPSGRASGGNKYRTYIKFLNFKSTLKGATVSSAKLNCYENGDGLSDKVVRVYKILEDWDYTDVTWNTVPDHGAATSYLDAITSSGTANKKQSFDLTDWVQDVVMDNESNYGIAIKNQVEASISYCEFYGTRSTSTAYRPYLSITYTADKPATPTVTSNTGSNVYIKGNSVSLSWSGMTCNFLDHVEYKITKADSSGNTGDTIQEYTHLLTTSRSSGSATIPRTSSLATGYYQIFIRGVSEMGTNGTGRIYGIRIVKDKPATPNVTAAQDTYPAGSDIVVNWTGLTGNNLTKAQYRIELSDENWEQVEYAYVPYTTFTTSPTASGSLIIPDGDLLDPGYYKIYIRGVNSSGVYGTGYGCRVQIVEDEEPEVGNITFKKGSTETDYYTYVSPGAITVTVSDMYDDSPVVGSNLWYLLSKPDKTYIYDDLTGYTVTNLGNDYYRVTFTIPESQVQQSGLYSLYFEISDDGGNSNYDIQFFSIDATPPTGSISAALVTTGESSDLLEDTALITVNVNDAHSGIASSKLTLHKGTKASVGEQVGVLATNSSIKKIIAFDSTAYSDGEYTLKLDMTDNVGNTATVWKDIRIENQMVKPSIHVYPNVGNSNLSVDWGFQSEMQELSKLQYKLDDAQVWTDVTISGKTTGSFTIPLPEDINGTHSILVRGVDAEGIYGKAQREDFNIDTTTPTVSIDNIQRGIIIGSINDEYLDRWTVYVRERDNEESTYTELTSGSKSVTAGRIGVADLSGSKYADNSWYTIKVEAVDESGNTSSDTFDVYKDAAYKPASLLISENRIMRSLGQNMKKANFIVSSTEDALEMKNGNLLSTVLWVVNGAAASSSSKYQTDFSTFTASVNNTIAAVGKDASGNIYYSNDVYVDETGDSFTFGLPSENQIEQTVQLSKKAVAFRLDVPESIAINLDASEVETNLTTEGVITYYAKVGNGEYQQITPGSLTHIYNLNSEMIATDSVTIKAVSENEEALSQLDAFSVSLAVMEEETFTVSPTESYWPENVSAQDKINYKTYVKWNTPETMPTGLSYEVHRSTISNFVPSEQTLVAENVTDGYWIDINTNYSISLYYKVRAVLKDANGNVITASSYSDLAESTPIDSDEYLKALGHKEYWAYADIATPAGSGYIEKSQGNFLYEQVFAELENEQLPISFTGTYNSLSSSKSALGYGWTHSYDIELLRLGKDSNLDEGILVLKDGNGTLYQFRADGDTYISSMGKYVSLVKENLTETVALPSPTDENANMTVSVSINSAYTMTTRDNVSYRFDESGKLAYMEEANGNILLFDYDTQRGLLNKITTGNGISINFEYHNSVDGNDALTLSKLFLPDGQTVLYDYAASKLTKVTKLAAGEVSGGITYSFAYNANRKMTSLTDAMANTYAITYLDAVKGEAQKFTYPSAGGSAESIRITRDSENKITTTEKLVGNTVVKLEKDYFDGAGLKVRHEAYSDIDGEMVVSSYEYMDSLLVKEITSASYNVLSNDSNTGISAIAKTTAEKVKTYEYDSEELLTSEKEEGKTTGTYVYGNTGAWNKHLPSGYIEYADDEEEPTVNESYEYDVYGNMTKLYDNVSETVTVYEYYTGASDKAKGAVKSEKQYQLKNGSYSEATLISSSDTSFSYAQDGTKTETVTSISDGNKTVNITVYDVMGRTLSETVYTYTAYGTANQSISKELQNYTYDGYGRVISSAVTKSKVNAALEDIEDTVFTETQTKAYDANGTLTEETTADGITTAYTYDALNRITSATKQSLGLLQTTLTSYGYGSVNVNTGKATSDTYSSAFITTQTVDGKEISKSYQDGMGRTVRSINYGVITDYSYDAQGNRITEMVLTDSQGNGRLTYHVLDENGKETATVYNPAWDAEKETFTVGANSIVETSVFDKSGNIISQTDGEGNVTELSYDEQGRLVKVILADGNDRSNVTTYVYGDSVEDSVYTSTVTATDANGVVSVEISNEAGNVIKTSDKGKTSESLTAIETIYAYDAKGNLLKEVHKAGDYITYAYDSKDRLVTKTQYNASGSAVYKTVYTYYGNDLVKEMLDYTVDGNVQTLYRYTYNEYDGLNRLVKFAEVNTNAVPSSIDPYAITYSYDLSDNVTEIVYGSAIGSETDAVKYVYTDNRLTEIKIKVGNTYYTAKEYTYNYDGSVNTVEDYYNFRAGDSTNCITLTYSYDTFGRVSAMVYTKGGQTIESHLYSYDKNNNIVKEENTNSFENLNEVRYYEYNYKGELTSSVINDVVTTYREVEIGEADEDGNVLTTTEAVTEETLRLNTSYTYDKVGNRTKKVVNGVTTNYTYNGLNQLTAESGVNNLTYTYDANGNQISVTGGSANKYYSYTPAGMLATYASGSDSQNNLYNGNGQRVRKTEGTDVTNYFYQNDSVLYTTDNAGSLKAFNLLNVSDAFATSRISGNGESYYFYTEDQRGSTINVLDSGANRVVSYQYTDFGEVSETKANGYSNFVNEIQYTGAIYDELTGLLYLNARFYDPSTGRFITQDSYRGEKNDEDTWHLYAYCANNPINYVDPSGHFAVSRGFVSLVFDFAIGWGINRFAGEIISKTAFSVLKKAFKEVCLESKSTKAVTRFVKSNKKTMTKMARNFSKKFNKIMPLVERSPLYKLSTIFKKGEKQWIKKKMKTVAKKGIVTILTDKITNYINSILKYGAIDCLISPGGFLAGALELKLDGNLDGEIEF